MQRVSLCIFTNLRQIFRTIYLFFFSPYRIHLSDTAAKWRGGRAGYAIQLFSPGFNSPGRLTRMNRFESRYCVYTPTIVAYRNCFMKYIEIFFFFLLSSILHSDG